MFPSRVPILRRWQTALFAVSSVGLVLAALSPALAAETAVAAAVAKPDMKACGERWRAAKASGATNGQTWPQFLKVCRSGVSPAAGQAAAADKPDPKAVARACGDQWKAAKAANTVPAGQTWPQYFAVCRAAANGEPAASQAAPASPGNAQTASAASASGAQTDTAAVVAPLAAAAGTVDIDPGSTAAANPAAAKKPAAKKPGPASGAARSVTMAALNSRRKTCGAEWKQAKAAGTVPPGQKWPQFWSACNTKLKVADTTAATP